MVKDPVPRGGLKAHRTREKRFLQPGENKNPARKQVRKNKSVVPQDFPETSNCQNTCLPQHNYVQPPNTFHPGWGSHDQYVSESHTLQIKLKQILM